MLLIRTLAQPQTPEEAYTLLHSKKTAALLGGGAYLRMSKKTLDPAIDLGTLKLNTIDSTPKGFTLGAMVTFGQCERSAPLNDTYFNLFKEALGTVVGVQFRNTVTLGATVYSRYGFSDLITPLLALNADVHLHRHGSMPLETFMTFPRSEKDLLTHIELKNTCQWAGYRSVRLATGDYASLNITLAKCGHQWRIAVGARPGAARLAHQTMDLLGSGSWTTERIEKASATIAQELTYGSNSRGSASYRRQLASALLKDLIEEAIPHGN